MTIQIVDERIETYMRALLDRYDEPVLLEMEAEAEANGFPIVGRQVGITLEVITRAAGAERIFELGSGYGYSAYWFSRAAEEVHCTDGDPENAKKAEAYLSRAGVWDRIRYRVGDAVEGLASVDGEFDIVYCDIDKHGYPDAWRAARERVRVGGLYICDNVLWSGRVAETDPDDSRPEWTAAIRQHNAMIAGDPAWASTILPTRDGVMVATRLA